MMHGQKNIKLTLSSLNIDKVTSLRQLVGTFASLHICLRLQPTQPITSVWMVTYN